MQPAAHIDFETRSAVDLIRCGSHRYAEDPSTEILCLSYRLPGASINEWRPGLPLPIDLLLWVMSGGRTMAHNAAFERRIWNLVFIVRYAPGWPSLTIAQQDCTLARAMGVHLPPKLEKLSEVLRLQAPKDMEGQALMKRLCKPKHVHLDGRIEWHEPTPAEQDRLQQYCSGDVAAEEEVDTRVPPLTPEERETWEFDQLVNDRGFRLDVPLITKMLAVAEEAIRRANREMWELTEGAVSTCSQVAKIVKWLEARGIATKSIGKGEREKLIDLSRLFGDTVAERVIALRNEAAKCISAKGKLATGLRCVCADNRARNMVRYCGASATRRWAGSLFQPHNMPRVDADDELPWVLEFVDIVSAAPNPRHAFSMTKALIGSPMIWVQKSLRSTIIAAPGHRLIGADYSNVEGRFNAWLGDEDWKLRAFQDYDDGRGPDLYRVSYAESFGVPVEQVKKGPLRQIGKVQELALGYQGGVGAFISMGANYGVKPDLIRAAILDDVRDTEDWQRASRQYEEAPARFNLSRDQWICLRIVVNKWRTRHAGITQSWWDLQDAAVAAMESPHTIIPVLGGRVKYLWNEGCLWCQLPTGGVLCYQAPRLVERKEARFVDDDGELIEGLDESEILLGVLLGEIKVEERRTKVSVAFDGQNQKTKQWGTQYLYGGLQSNNVVQGSCRDLLAAGLKRVERAGYPVVLHVHDEGVAEVQEAFGASDHFAALLAEKPLGFDLLPLVAKAWEHHRYVK